MTGGEKKKEEKKERYISLQPHRTVPYSGVHCQRAEKEGGGKRGKKEVSYRPAERGSRGGCVERDEGGRGRRGKRRLTYWAQGGNPSLRVIEQLKGDRGGGGGNRRGEEEPLTLSSHASSFRRHSVTEERKGKGQKRERKGETLNQIGGRSPTSSGDGGSIATPMGGRWGEKMAW